MRRKLDGAVHPVNGRIVGVETLHHEQQGGDGEFFRPDFPPAGDGFGRVRNESGPVQNEQRPATGPDVPGILEMPAEIGEKRLRVRVRIILLEDDLAVVSIPAARPVFVCPHDGKWKIQFRTGKKRLDRFLQDAFAAEPIIIKAEPVQARLLCHLDLPGHDVRLTKIVITELFGQPRLIVAGEPGHGARDIAPFGESRAPGFVVFGNGMKLRQIECDRLGARRPGTDQVRVALLEECRRRRRVANIFIDRL